MFIISIRLFVFLIICYHYLMMNKLVCIARTCCRNCAIFRVKIVVLLIFTVNK